MCVFMFIRRDIINCTHSHILYICTCPASIYVNHNNEEESFVSLSGMSNNKFVEMNKTHIWF